ncbi:MAG: sulfite exporter TauE/SafE family protein [Rubripirellula sp.]
MDTLLSLIPFALIVCAGIFVQAAAGFAGGLVIVPALLWCGYSLPEAQASLLVATIPQNGLGVWSLRESIEPRRVLWPGVGRVAFLPVGAWCLVSMESLNMDTIRQIVGGFVLAATIATIVFQPQPKQHLHPIWAFLAFPISGFTQGLVGMGGPVMVFWVQAHDWSTRQSRGFLFTMYAVSILPALGILYAFFGDRIIAPGLMSAATVPLLMVATHYGLKLGTKMGRRRLRTVTLGILLVIGIAGIAAPLLRGS